MAPVAEVLVVGDALLDVVVSPSGPMRPGGDVPAEIRLEPGGQGANVAVRLARQGLGVRLACALGTDAAAGLIRERLDAEDVELVEVGASVTGAVVVLLDPAGERTMLSQRLPLGSRFALAVPPPPEGWLVVSGYVLLEPQVGISGSGEAPRRVLLGCSLHRGDAARWADAARSLSPHLVVLNADEARALAGDGDPASLAGGVAKRLGGVAIVTHATGVAAALDGEAFEVAGRPAPAIDATGAGDAFAAGLIAGLADGPWPPDRDRLRQGMAAGARLAAAVSRVLGAQTRVDEERV
jgi:ribokinase